MPDVDQHSFENVVVTAEVYPSHSASLEGVSKAPLDVLASVAQELFPATAPDTPTILVSRSLGVGFAAPVAPASLRLGDVGASTLPAQSHQHGVAVVALVRDPFRRS
jgi:hypothetical protein